MSDERIEAWRLVSIIARDAAAAIQALSQMVEVTQDMNESGAPGDAATGGNVHGPSIGPHLEAMKVAMGSVSQHVQTLGGHVANLGNYRLLT